MSTIPHDLEIKPAQKVMKEGQSMKRPYGEEERIWYSILFFLCVSTHAFP
jgi:hypothetical protein